MLLSRRKELTFPAPENNGGRRGLNQKKTRKYILKRRGEEIASYRGKGRGKRVIKGHFRQGCVL